MASPKTGKFTITRGSNVRRSACLRSVIELIMVSCRRTCGPFARTASASTSTVPTLAATMYELTENCPRFELRTDRSQDATGHVHDASDAIVGRMQKTSPQAKDLWTRDKKTCVRF